MLQVVSVALGYLAIDGLLDPRNLVHKLVAVLLHELNSEAVLGIDHPDEEEAVSLQFIEGNVEDLAVLQGIVGYGYASRGVGGGELPWWVAGYYVE